MSTPSRAKRSVHDLVPSRAEIAGDDQVVVRGRGARVRKRALRSVSYAAGAIAAPMLFASVMPQVHDAPDGRVRDGMGPLPSPDQDAAARRRGRPLGGRRALASRRARASGTAARRCRSARRSSPQRGGQSRRRLLMAASARLSPIVEHAPYTPQQRHAELPQGEGGADALVQKVAGKDEVSAPPACASPSPARGKARASAYGPRPSPRSFRRRRNPRSARQNSPPSGPVPPASRRCWQSSPRAADVKSAASVRRSVWSPYHFPLCL